MVDENQATGEGGAEGCVPVQTVENKNPQIQVTMAITTSSIAPWQRKLKANLAQRDSAWPPLAAAFATANASVHRVAQLEARVAALTAQSAEAAAALANAQALGSTHAQRKFADMEAQIAALKEEQRETYKTQSLNAQRLLEMVETIQTFEHTKKVMTDENAKFATANAVLNAKLRDATELLREKDAVIQIVKDEMAALQLELVQREEQLKASNDKLKKLDSENAELVDRWIKLKQDEAAKMNEANEFVESALKSKKTALTERQTSRENQFEDSTKPTCFPPSVAVRKIALHDGDINCIAVNRDGSLIATGGNDKKLIITDTSTGSVRTSLIGSLQSVMSANFSLDGDLIMGTSNDNSVKIWSLSTNRLRHTLTGHIGKVFSAQFTDSTNRVISGSHDRTIKIWDLNKGYCLKTIFTLSSCNDLDLLDGEGTLIVSGHLDNNLRVWDTRTGNLVREVSGLHSGQISGVTIAPNRNYLLTTSRDNLLKLVDIRTFETVASYQHENFRIGMNWTSSCFSSDGSLVASGSFDGSMYIWNTETSKVEKILKEHKSAICGVVWNPRGGASCFSAEKERGVVFWGASA
ncbi:hypothetical protein HDU78_009738 [Chytriomyces hyalinus]|nr:hypothetical protein HDU78_009738 [Chytriomyces hyalinus]